MSNFNIHEEFRILYLARSLYDAVEDCNIQQVNTLLSQHKANPNVLIPEEGMTPFHLAAGHEDLTFGKVVCSLFLHNGGDPNVLCEGNRTVLHLAVAWNRYVIVKTLLKSPYIVPDLYIKDEDGLNVFNYSVKFNAWESLTILQSAIKYLKSTSSNNQIFNTIQSKYIEKDNSISNSTIYESDTLHTSSGYFNSGESLNDTSISVKNNSISLQHNLSISNVNDSFNKNNSLDYMNNALIEDISSSDGFVMNSITPNHELTPEKTFNSLNEFNSNNTEWMTDVSEFSNCEEYFTCPETNSKQQIMINKMEKADITHNISQKSLCNLTRSVSKMSMEINNLEMKNNHNSSSGENISNLTEISNDYDTDYIKYNLRKYGFYPGPIVTSTKKLYLRKLNRIKKNHFESINGDKHINISLVEYSYSSQLIEVLKNDQYDTWKKLLKTWSTLEKDIIFNQSGSSFTYLLLDPRITKNLPARVDLINNSFEIWKIFINSIFYIGKGTNSRPNDHIREAFNSWITKSNKEFSAKTEYILNLWKEKMGVVCVQAFHNLVQNEANIREAAMIDAVGLHKLTNKKHGTYYNSSKQWTKSERCKLGCHLLYRAMGVFLADGERQLQPIDLT